MCVIAHRLSTILHCDRILVLIKVISGIGCYEDLIEITLPSEVLCWQRAMSLSYFESVCGHMYDKILKILIHFLLDSVLIDIIKYKL